MPRKVRHISLFDKESVLKRLWESTIQNERGCRLWTGAISNGFGVVRLKRFGPKFYVHRLSAYIYHGLNIDNRQEQANHRDELCENRNCWAPEHLKIGSHLSNIQDAVLNKTHFTPKAKR